MENLHLPAYDYAVFEEFVVLAHSTVHVIVGIDDDVRIRESLESLVESAGFASFVFPSAEEFMRSGMLAKASCLITDITDARNGRD